MIQVLEIGRILAGDLEVDRVVPTALPSGPAVFVSYKAGGSTPVLGLLVLPGRTELFLLTNRLEGSDEGLTIRLAIGRMQDITLPNSFDVGRIRNVSGSNAGDFAAEVLLEADAFLRKDAPTVLRGTAEEMMRRLVAAATRLGHRWTVRVRAQRSGRRPWRVRSLKPYPLPIVHILDWHDPIGTEPDISHRPALRVGLNLEIEPEEPSSGHRALEIEETLRRFYNEAGRRIPYTERMAALRMLGLDQ